MTLTVFSLSSTARMASVDCLNTAIQGGAAVAMAASEGSGNPLAMLPIAIIEWWTSRIEAMSSGPEAEIWRLVEITASKGLTAA